MPISILGAGSFGTAIAHSLASRGERALLWCRDPEQACSINEKHENPRHLKGCALSSSLTATSSLSAALEPGHVILAVPTQSLRAVLERVRSFPVGGKRFLCLSKGIEISTGLMPDQIFDEMMPKASFSVLSGPSHAEEVVRELPTAVIVASHEPEAALEWQELLNSPRFRVYTSGDVTGVELGAAVKNVIAIAAGTAYALELGDNARAALATRGLAEIMRLGMAMGAELSTLAGLAGVGDLMVTCYSLHSRNFRFGMAIGRGAGPDEAAAEIGEVVEGAHTVRALVALARSRGVELPISEGVHALLYEGAALQDVIGRLLFREPRAEHQS
ncbi:MAG: NAD(P)-dependent glycerol-3-phosphate dehydrogenase [Fretibacterium sp.]|nr:NAD(P)-dependent glycerol-3-phosphate dehydrogenase [Fretibacterium sp.]